MDEDTRDFLQHIHDSLERCVAGDIESLRAAMDRRFDGVATTEQLSALELRVTQLRDSMLQYARHTEILLTDFSGSQAALAAQVQDLQRRVAALEIRLPPAAN